MKENWQTADCANYDILKQYARENRKNMTDAESALWSFLKNSFSGVNFLRQHIIGDYIVDFLCRKNKLVIEVDGAYHSEPQQQKADEYRQHWLEQQGYIVLRFTNEEVLNDTENTLCRIKKYIN